MVLGGPLVVGAAFGGIPILFFIAFACLVAILAAFLWRYRERPVFVLGVLTVWLVVERFALAAISQQLTPTTLAVLLGYNELFFPLMLIVAAPRMRGVFASARLPIRAIDIVVIAFALYVLVSFILSPAPFLDRLTYARRLAILPLIYAVARLQPIDGKGVIRYVRVLLIAAVALAIFGLLERFWLESLIWREWIPTMHFYQMQQATGVTTSTSPEAGFEGLPLTYWVFDAGVPGRRLVSTSIEATTVAMFFAIGTVVAMATQRWTRTRAAAAILLGVATSLTLGKAGVGVVLLGFSYLVLIHWRPMRHPAWVAEGGVAAFLILITVGGILATTGVGEIVSTGAFLHLDGFVEGLVVASQHPLGLGVGIGGGYASVRTGAESTFGTMLVQIGWPGLLMWSAWILGAAAACAAVGPLLSSNRLLGYGVAASLAGFFATAALTESAGGLSGNWPYPLLAGLIVAAAPLRLAETRRSARRSVSAWIVDPISYSGLAYSDLGLAGGLARAGVPVSIMGSDRWLVRREIDGVSLHPIFAGNRPGRGRVGRGIAYAVGLVRLVREARRAQKGLVVHWQYLELPLLDLIAMKALAASGVPQVYTAHELLPWGARGYHGTVFRWIYATMSRVVLHNEADRQELVDQFGVNDARVAVIQHGDYRLFATPETPQSDARNRLGLDDQVPVALFFGSLRPAKGLDVLLEAWPLVLERLPQARLVVAGRPYKRSTELDTIKGSPDWRASVTVVETEIDPDAANDFYRASDVVVLPYRAITTSGVLRYAYSSGRCVVATSVGEHPTWVQDRVTGRLVPPVDPAALADALVEVLTDRAAAEKMGRAAYDLSNVHFDWAPIGREMADLYRRIYQVTN